MMFDSFEAYDVQETRRVSREEEERAGRIEGEQLYLIKQVIKRIIKNISVSQIAADLLEPLDTIQPIYDLAMKQAPDFDAEKILAQLIPKTTESLSKQQNGKKTPCFFFLKHGVFHWYILIISI